MTSLPPPQSGRTPAGISSEARRAALRQPHPLDARDYFANDPDGDVRELGRLALRRADVNDYFALGDLCARLSLTDTNRLRVFYVGKTLIAYRRAGGDALNDVDRALARRARDRYINWTIEIARTYPTRRNLAVALWALSDDDDDPPSSGTGEWPRRAPTDLLYTLLRLNETSVPVPAESVDEGATESPFGEATEFAGFDAVLPLSEFEALPAAAGSRTSADDPTQIMGVSAAMLVPPTEDGGLNVGRDNGHDDWQDEAQYGEFRPGDRILDRYEVADVKTGGMGIVYLCYDHLQREPVALKSFQSKYLDNPRAVARFEQEA
ncbi:MAG: hypothetical protein IPK19_26025, partial [Chloroflexi bacterium]|nr:hypothetical protein [Chloroflexota bacterium]